VTGKICRERKGRDVYVIGAANVGKSAFVRAMLKVSYAAYGFY
jgi:nitric-oxide synthase